MRLPPWVNFDAPRADLQQPGALGWCTLADGRQTTNLGVGGSNPFGRASNILINTTDC